MFTKTLSASRALPKSGFFAHSLRNITSPKNTSQLLECYPLLSREPHVIENNFKKNKIILGNLIEKIENNNEPITSALNRLSFSARKDIFLESVFLHLINHTETLLEENFFITIAHAIEKVSKIEELETIYQDIKNAHFVQNFSDDMLLDFIILGQVNESILATLKEECKELVDEKDSLGFKL